MASLGNGAVSRASLPRAPGAALLLGLALAAGCTGSSGDTDPGTPTPSSSPVVLNEFQAANSVTLQAEAGNFPDWIELYNQSDELVDLSAWTLSDDPAQPQRWSFPSGTTIAAGGYLLVFASGGDAVSTVTELHANFALSRTGEELLLVGPAAQDLPIMDHVVFGIQYQDWSYARVPNGTGPWIDVEVPTPNGPNG